MQIMRVQLSKNESGLRQTGNGNPLWSKTPKGEKGVQEINPIEAVIIWKKWFFKSSDQNYFKKFSLPNTFEFNQNVALLLKSGQKK